MTALRIVNADIGYLLQEYIDAVLVESDGRHIPTDYKSSGNAPAEDKQKYYRDQLAAYGFMFKKHGREVSDRAFLLHYFVRDKSNPSIVGQFDSHVDLIKLDLQGFEKRLEKIVELLNGPYPGHNDDCNNCSYHNGRTELPKK